jgi:hypothetical protein
MKKIDIRAIEVAIQRLKREIQIRGNLDYYIRGYKEAICDFLWDYANKEPTIWKKYADEIKQLGDSQTDHIRAIGGAYGK